MTREEKLAAALGNDWEYAGGVGYCYKGNHQQEKAVVDKAIHDRVRELWCVERENPKYESRYVEITYLSASRFNLSLVREVLGVNGYDQHPAFIIDEKLIDTEVAAWGNALLWLANQKGNKDD